MKWLKNLWCDWTHGGGKITRDMNDCINWQCCKCGRWAVAVTHAQEKHLIDKAMKDRFERKEI